MVEIRTNFSEIHSTKWRIIRIKRTSIVIKLHIHKTEMFACDFGKNTFFEVLSTSVLKVYFKNVYLFGIDCITNSKLCKLGTG